MKNLLTQVNLYPDEGFEGFGKLGLEGEPATNASVIFKDFLSGVVGILTIIAIIWSLFTFITGAISYVSSGGDKARVESAGKKITNGIIGLVLVIISIFVIKLVGYLLGIPDILNFLLMWGNITGSVVNP